MSYPRKAYIAFSSCGYRVMSEPEVVGAHAAPAEPQPETVPCGPGKKPDVPEPRRISRFNWIGEADVDNPAFRSPIDAYRARKRAARPRKIAAMAVLLLLIAFGVGTVAFAVTQNAAGSLADTHVFSSAYPLFPGSGKTTGPKGATSTPASDWVKGEAPLLYQKDTQWMGKPYASSTIGSSGQAPLCLTMALVTLTGSQDIDPVNIASTIEAGGFAQKGVTDPACITGSAEALGLKTTDVTIDEMSIRKQLIAGKPIICVMGPGDFTETRTFILLTGIDMDSKLIVRDPASEDRTAKSWDFATIIGQAESMTALSALPAA